MIYAFPTLNEVLRTNQRPKSLWPKHYSELKLT